MELHMIIITALSAVGAFVLGYVTLMVAKNKAMIQDAERIRTIESDIGHLKEESDTKIHNVHTALSHQITTVKESLEAHGRDELRQWDQVNRMNETISNLLSELTAQREIQMTVRNEVGKISNTMERFADAFVEIPHMQKDIDVIKKKLNM